MFTRLWRRIKWWYYEWKNGRTVKYGRCPNCGRSSLLHYQSSMTMYVDESQNFNGHLCRYCKDAYVDFWQSCWDDYNSSRY